MKITIDIGCWNSDGIMRQLQTLFKFDSYTVNMSDQSITIAPTAVRTSLPVERATGTFQEIKAEPVSSCSQFKTQPKITTRAEPAPQSIKVKEPIKDAHDDLKGTCPVCNKTFVKKALNQVYCSERCSRAASYQREKQAAAKNKPVTPKTTLHAGTDGKTKICPECGKSFQRTSMRQIYCSSTCQSRAKRKRLGMMSTFVPTEQICPVCNKKFMPNRVGQKYCSHDCKRNNERKTKKVDDNAGPVVFIKPLEPVPLKDAIKFVPESQRVPIMRDKTPEEILAEAAYTNKCELCGNTFKTLNKNQRFCKPCIDSFGEAECEVLVKEEAEKKRAIEEAAKVRFKVCPRCGHNFEAKNPAKDFFCPTCVERALKVPKLEKKEGEQ